MNQESTVPPLSRCDFLPFAHDVCQNPSPSSQTSSSFDDHRQVLGNAPSIQPVHKRFARDSLGKLMIVHPYARLFAKEDDTRRRRIWNHALEKNIFTPYELTTLAAPHRRKIYQASLEAHIDELHGRLFDLGCCPISPQELEPLRGLNSKTARTMVSKFQHQVSVAKLKLLELERANKELERLLQASNLSKEESGLSAGQP